MSLELESIKIEAIANVVERPDGLDIDWALEGGISALEGPTRLFAITQGHIAEGACGGRFVSLERLGTLLAQMAKQQEAHMHLNEHNNECERQLDDAVALLVEIAKGSDTYYECTDKSSATGERIAALSKYVAQFQAEPHRPSDNETDAADRDWRMNPCKQGHRDVGAAGGVAHCYQCDEKIIAETTQAAFEQWNATHPKELA
jgi:hypothetical protein